MPGVAPMYLGSANCPSGKISAVLSDGEEPLRAAMDFPDLAQHGQWRLAQRQGALFVAFADDPQEHPLRVDRGNGKCDRFADPQAAGVDQREAAAVDRAFDRGDQAAAVLVASRIGKAFAIGLADLFFVKSGQS